MLWWIHNVWIPCDLRTCCSTWAWAEQWDTSSIYPRKKQVELGLGDLISHVICTVRKHIQGRNDSIEINDSPRTTNLCTHKNITIISIYVVVQQVLDYHNLNYRNPWNNVIPKILRYCKKWLVKITLIKEQPYYLD